MKLFVSMFMVMDFGMTKAQSISDVDVCSNVCRDHRIDVVVHKGTAYAEISSQDNHVCLVSEHGRLISARLQSSKVTQSMCIFGRRTSIVSGDRVFDRLGRGTWGSRGRVWTRIGQIDT